LHIRINKLWRRGRLPLVGAPVYAFQFNLVNHLLIDLQILKDVPTPFSAFHLHLTILHQIFHQLKFANLNHHLFHRLLSHHPWIRL